MTETEPDPGRADSHHLQIGSGSHRDGVRNGATPLHARLRPFQSGTELHACNGLIQIGAASDPRTNQVLVMSYVTAFLEAFTISGYECYQVSPRTAA